MTFFVHQADVDDRANNFVPKRLSEGLDVFAIHTRIGSVHQDRVKTLWDAACTPDIEVVRVDIFDSGRSATFYEFDRGGHFYVVGKRALMILILAAPDVIYSVCKARQVNNLAKSVIWEEYVTVATNGK